MRMCFFGKAMVAGAVLAVAGGAALAGQNEAAGQVVNIYSYRQPFLIKPFLKAFTERTGIRVNVVFAKKGVVERLKAEGENTSADMVLTSDISRLAALKAAGLTQAVDSVLLAAAIPAHLRDPEGHWFGLSKRARVIIAHRTRVKPDEVKDYEDLAKPHMKGRVCIRSGKNTYNISLFASFIAHKGEAETEQFLRALKSNLARKPQGNDRAQAKAIHEGQCDVALINTYYMGKMLTNEKKPEQKAWAAAVRVIFPNQDNRGTHMNISGAVIVKHARHKTAAVKLLEFLAGDMAQTMYAAMNHEYPVKPGVGWSDLLKSWGAFREDTLPLARVGEHGPAAARLVDKVGFDH